MSVATPTVAPVADQWDEAEAAAGHDDRSSEVLLASHLLGANRALANFGGGNTSAKGTATDHVGREVPAIWVKGSGSDLATMTGVGLHAAAARRDPSAARARRDERRGDGRPPRRCQLDPAAPRSSIETLLHAFIPAAHVHHTHPDAINVLACAARRARADRRVLRRQRRVDRVHPPGLHAGQAGRRGGAGQPGVGLVVLAKHGLVVWGDTAREAYEQTVAVCNQAAELVNRAQPSGPRASAGPSARSPARRRRPRRRRCARSFPALRGAVSSARAKLLLTDISPPVLRARRLALQGAEIATVGAACPDHLVHTKRVPMWVAYDPAADDVEELRARLARAPPRTAPSTRRTSSGTPATDDVMADPDPRVVLIENLGHGHRRARR